MVNAEPDEDRHIVTYGTLENDPLGIEKHKAYHTVQYYHRQKKRLAPATTYT